MSLYEFRFRLVYNISWLCMFVPLAKDCPKPLVPDWHASPQWYLQPRFVSIPNRSWCCLSWLRCTETCEMSQYQPSHVLRHSWVAATSKVRAVQLVEAALISKQSRIRWNDMECLQLEPEHGNVEKGIAGHMAVEGRCIVMMHFKGLNTFECFGCHCCSQVLSWVRNQHCKCSEGSSFGEKMLELIWLTWCLQSLQSSSILFNPLQSSSILFNPLQSSSILFISFHLFPLAGLDTNKVLLQKCPQLQSLTFQQTNFLCARRGRFSFARARVSSWCPSTRLGNLPFFLACFLLCEKGISMKSCRTPSAALPCT